MIHCHPPGLRNEDLLICLLVLHQQLAPKHCWSGLDEEDGFQLRSLFLACCGPQPSSGKLPALAITQTATPKAPEEMIDHDRDYMT